MKFSQRLKYMNEAWSRIKALIVKEILAVWRDKKSRIVLIGRPLIQLIVLSHAATLDVSNISIGIYNQDRGEHSYELIQRIKGAPYFTHVYEFESSQEVRHAIDTQKVLLSLQFQQNFSRLIDGDRQASVQVTLDGRKSNASQIVGGYLTLILQNLNKDILIRKGIAVPEPIDIAFRALFNPNLDYVLYTVPCIVGILSM